jgi:hypothetical protein
LSALSGITEDRLQDLISNSMQEATKELMKTISHVASVDPDAARLLYQAASNITPDTADILNLTARSFSKTVNPGNVERLYDAAALLYRLGLADVISNLDALVPRLQLAVRDLRNAQGEI